MPAGAAKQESSDIYLKYGFYTSFTSVLASLGRRPRQLSRPTVPTRTMRPTPTTGVGRICFFSGKSPLPNFPAMEMALWRGNQ